MTPKTIFKREWLAKFMIRDISKEETGGKIMEEICIILATVLFLRLNFIIMLHSLHIYYIITYFLCNLGDDFPLDDYFSAFKIYIY